MSVNLNTKPNISTDQSSRINSNDFDNMFSSVKNASLKPDDTTSNMEDVALLAHQVLGQKMTQVSMIV